MRRAFPILAAVAGLLLARGLVDRPDLPAVAATLAAHGSAFAYLGATARRVEAWSKDRGWPDWVGAQAEKNRRKAFVYQAFGSAILGFSAWASWSLGDLWWQASVSACDLSFQVGAFAGEFAIIAAQSRLLRDVRGWAGA